MNHLSVGILTNLEELSFLAVFALPNAANQNQNHQQAVLNRESTKLFKTNNMNDTNTLQTEPLEASITLYHYCIITDQAFN